ncbi:MAG: hypothetical protein ACR2N5_03395 [Solirubrobacterales bacterium]
MAELSIKRALFGYRCREVEELVGARDAELELRSAEIRVHCARISELEALAQLLTAQVVERERDLHAARVEIAEARFGPDTGLGLIDALVARVEELHAQARGQATRIRLAALNQAATIEARPNGQSRSPADEQQAHTEAEADRSVEVPIRRVAPRAPAHRAGEEIESLVLGGAGADGTGVLAGPVRIDVGPLADFAQLIRIEDAARAIDAASEISIERFSGGRATLAVNLNEPVELLRELEDRSDLEFRVRRADADELVLDVGASATAT